MLEAKNFGMKNKEAFLSAYNYGMKSDILRYEILHSFGGVYIDTDYECVMNIGKCTTHNLLDFLFLFLSSIILREYLLLFILDFLCRANTFFAGISNTSAVEINNGFLG